MALVWILTLSILVGQLVKIPLGTHGGLTLLDITVIGLCLVGAYQTRLRLKKPPKFIIAAIIFAIIAALSLSLTPLHLTTPQYLTSFFYTVRFSLYILLSWLILSGALKPLGENINKILLFSGIGLAILGLQQFIFLPDLRFLTSGGLDPHYFRTASTFLDPNFLGAYFVLTLLLIFPKHKFVWILIVYLALLTTFSRSSYGMFLVSFLTLSFFKRSLKLAVITVILFAVFLLSFQIYIRAVNRVLPLDRNQTASYRFSTWQQGFEIFLKNPLLGVGFNTYNFALYEYNLGDEQFLKGKGSTSNDSSLLHILSTTGIVGLFAYFLFIHNLIKIANPTLTAATLGLLGHSFFVNSLFYPFILIWIMLMASNLYGKSDH